MKTSTTRATALLVLVIAASVVGCANTWPPGRSELYGERWNTTDIDTYPVRIQSVDGSSSTTIPQYVEPGPRRLLLQTTPGGAGFRDTVTFVLDVKPCLRYYIVAVKANPLDTNFKPRVDHEMPLGSSCKRAG
ncbi:MAG: hypothetical protein ABIR94_08330 [Rubrivivax sp.]